MAFCTRKYMGLIILLFLLGVASKMNAQGSTSSPQIRCVAVDSAGNVTLTWVLPTNLNGNFISYNIYEKGDPTAVAIVTTQTQTSVTIDSATLTSSPDSREVYFYMNVITTGGTSVPFDTISSIHLIVTPIPGIAELNWNAITPAPQGSSVWYRIYREYKSTWTLIDSTKNLFYNDTITYCSAILKYQVQIADSDICISSSNWAGSASPFTNQYPPGDIIMDTVSVNSLNTIDVTWSKSQNNNVAGYIIYEQEFVGGQWKYFPIDTVYGLNTTLFNFITGFPSDSSYSFGIAAIDSCGHTGAISATQKTMLLTEVPNSCARTNTLTWNSAGGIIGSIGGYILYYNVNGGPYQELAITTPGTTNFLDTDLITTENRCYYVSVYDSTNPEITASSNRVCYNISAPKKPKNNYLRTATVIFNSYGIDIEGFVDSTSGAGFYQFQRSSDSTSGFVTIDTMPAPPNSDYISYTDNSANPTTQSYFYRIVTEDSCYKPMDTTNNGETIYLTAFGQPTRVNTLSWNDYRDWHTGPAYYWIYRSLDGVNYTKMDTVAYSDAGENVYTDNVDTITEGQGIFYYYIKAVENTRARFFPYHFTDTSYSNIAEAYQNPLVFIPSAFSPGGPINKVFIPVGVFIGVTGYDFSIFNRWGNLIFESNNPTIGWNGKDGGSKIVQEGIYFYLLTYTSSKGEYFQQKGSVMLLK
jgi:hypothetical protein